MSREERETAKTRSAQRGFHKKTLSAVSNQRRNLFLLALFRYKTKSNDDCQLLKV